MRQVQIETKKKKLQKAPPKYQNPEVGSWRKGLAVGCIPLVRKEWRSGRVVQGKGAEKPDIWGVREIVPLKASKKKATEEGGNKNELGNNAI